MSAHLGLLAGSVVVSMAALGLGIGLPAAITRDPAELRFLRLLFVVALLVRCALAAVLYIKLPYGYFAPDETGTILAASDYLANRPTRSLGAHGQAWAYLNILIFDIFGTEPMLPRLWNCLVGAMTPVIGYALARDFGAIRGARWSAVLIGFFPSLVLWSSLNLHDVDAYLVILIALLLTTRLQQDPRWWRVVALALALLATYLLRIFADAALFIAVVAGLLAWRLRLPQRLAIRIVGVAGAAGVAVVVGALVFPRAGEFIYARSGLSLLAGLRRSLASGARSAVDVDPGLQSLGGVLAFLPVGLVDFFLRPFPWEGGSGLNLLTRPEVIFYYLLLPLVGIGMALAVRKAASRALPRLVFLGVTGLGYSLTLSNLGTIYRERDELLIVMFTFVGVAIDAIVSRLRTWRRRRT